jgi:uridine kinase
MNSHLIRAEYADYIDVFKRINALLERKKTITVAIDGGSASGKTTLAGLLSDLYDCNVFHMDDFFLPPERKTPKRLAEPGGTVDYERFAEEVAVGIQSGSGFSYRPYDCKTGSYKDAVTVVPKALNIIEGVYCLHPALSNLYDFRLFLKADKDTQIARILNRSGETMLNRFENEWIPLENIYFEKLGIEQSCDFVLDTDRKETNRITMKSC